MLRFRPDIKPPMWGSLDAVRFAVRANCERMGIDPASIVRYWPMWERGGPRLQELIGGGLATFGNVADMDALGLVLGDGTNVNTHVGVAGYSFPDDVDYFFSFGIWPIEYTSGVRIFAGYNNSISLNYVALYNGALRVRLSTACDFSSISDFSKPQSICVLAGAASGELSAIASTGAEQTITGMSNTALSMNNFGFYSTSYTATKIRLSHWIAASGGISADAARRMVYEPFALLMPVARPVYFDLGASAGTDNLTAADLVTGSPVLGAPALGQVNALTATGITTSAPALGTPALGQVHVLGYDGLVTGPPVLGSPAIAQIHALTALWLTVGAPVLGAPALGDYSFRPVFGSTLSFTAVRGSRLGLIATRAANPQFGRQ